MAEPVRFQMNAEGKHSGICFVKFASEEVRFRFVFLLPVEYAVISSCSIMTLWHAGSCSRPDEEQAISRTALRRSFPLECRGDEPENRSNCMLLSSVSTLSKGVHAYSLELLVIHDLRCRCCRYLNTSCSRSSFWLYAATRVWPETMLCCTFHVGRVLLVGCE